MEPDERGRRIALVADEYVNPASGSVDALAVLDAAGWGVMQIPGAWYPDAVAAPLMEQIAEQAAEFAGHGYTLVAVGRRPGLLEALALLGVPPPPRIDPADAAELVAFLATTVTTTPS